MLSLAFDPVYQALITIEQRPRYQNDLNTTAKRAQGFVDPSSGEYLTFLFTINCFTSMILSFSNTDIFYLSSNKRFHLVLSSDGQSTLSTDWTIGVTSAILSDTSILETDPFCPTRNCTFPVFSSLGFCSNCINITQFLQQNSNCTEILVPSQEYHPYASEEYRMKCIYWLPPSSSGLNYSAYIADGLAIQNGSFSLSWTSFRETYRNNWGNPELFEDAPSFLTRFVHVRDENGETFESYQAPFDLPDGKIIPSSITQIAMIKTSPRTGSISTGFIHTAHICALSFCAREYNISMTSGALRFEIVSTSYSNLTFQADDPESPSRGNSSYTFTFPDSTNDFTFIHGPTQVLNWNFDEAGMGEALSYMLEGNSTFSGPYDGDRLIQFGTSVLQSRLNASINIPKTMDRVAAAMTNHLRNLSSLNIYGQSGSMELYVRVSWPWLALPVLSVILGMILLISVMKVTRKHKLNIWKTSELALLFHGLDFSLHDTAEMDKVSEMEEIAMALQVRLGQGPRGGLQLQRKREDSGQTPTPCKNAISSHPQLASTSTFFSHDAAIL